MKTRLFFTVAAFIAMTAIATAQTTQPASDQVGKGRAAGNIYVDADKDGVCDNYTNGTRPGRKAYSACNNQNDANRCQGKGQGQAAGTGRSQGRGQGVADGSGQTRGNGQGRYNGRGPAFVDANNDGMCDNLTPIENK